MLILERHTLMDGTYFGINSYTLVVNLEFLTFHIDNPEGDCNKLPPPPSGKSVWDKCSGEYEYLMVTGLAIFSAILFSNSFHVSDYRNFWNTE